MEELDREMQHRVWQRVQQRQETQMPPLVRRELLPLALLAQQNGADYGRMARLLGGKDARKLQRLQQESGKCIACIKGLCRLRGEQVKLSPAQPGKDPSRRCLEGCYLREKQLCREFEDRAADPDHGVVFGRLAHQAREHCVTILEILGELER